MTRDLTERIDHFIHGSKSWSQFADSVRHLLDKIFLNGPLRPLKNLSSGKWLEHPLHPVLTDIPIGVWLMAIALDLTALVFRVPNLAVASSLAIGVGILGALGAVCAHFGAPLEEGRLRNVSIECPWHYSHFSLADGSVQEGPATSPLPMYETRIAGNKIQVKAKK